MWKRQNQTKSYQVTFHWKLIKKKGGGKKGSSSHDASADQMAKMKLKAAKGHAPELD